METMRHDLIYPNPDQPRKHFDQGALEELAQSIVVNGLLEPIIVTRRGEKYMIIAGERRWRACGIAGIEDVPVLVREADDKTVAELSLLENLQREDLNVIEIALAYKGLMDMGDTEESIAHKMGHKHIWLIKERLSLLNLQPVFQEYAIKGILSPAQALQISRLPTQQQGMVFDEISSGRLNTIEKVKSKVNALLFVREQESFLPEPSPEAKAVNTKYDRMIESIVHFINKSFDREDLTVLSAVLSPAARENVNRIDMIILHLNKIKRALLQSASNREALEQSTMTM